MMKSSKYNVGYSRVSNGEDDEKLQEPKISGVCGHGTRLAVFCAALGLLVVILAFTSLTAGGLRQSTSSCDSIKDGFQCQPNISHYWGQYSPYFSVPSKISSEVPQGCEITFAQVLSRHGARDPTAIKTLEYAAVIKKIQENVPEFTGPYAFLKDYKYTLGADQLTTFGQQELVNLGTEFYNRYNSLAKNFVPFVRASGQERVIQSAQKFTQGFHGARVADKSSAPDNYPYPILVISEADGSNNTLDHGKCTEFEGGPDSHTGFEAQKEWVEKFATPITARLNKHLPGANLNDYETIHFMDLCPFETVASPTGQISVFCGLFTTEEWHQFDYYQSLGKYYGYGNGNALGPTQGVGFTNELIARLTGKPVEDYTSVNHTLDDSNVTFPVGGQNVLFADFSHDNDLTSAFSALGLYNSTKPLSNISLQTPAETNGYSVAWTVPFAGRAYIEKMRCNFFHYELVRVIVNDRVIPLVTCGADELGRCSLEDFIGSLSFARHGGHWDRCFT